MAPVPAQVASRINNQLFDWIFSSLSQHPSRCRTGLAVDDLEPARGPGDPDPRCCGHDVREGTTGARDEWCDGKPGCGGSTRWLTDVWGR
ncbi:hypothetical protein EHS25_002207 [Saitozyma podzolica]|uniref:Uncharacterized protein n=1 Tax=Saitozyma podzolica TaxID=1890683 RepID=A0A427YF07_9TREE|nr:hypothetical protein EHS25_002207 [Saitozyma podzolica]